MRTFWTRVRTSDPRMSVIVTEDNGPGRIVALGDERLLHDRQSGDRVESLDNVFVTPGFWDSHVHLLDYGRSFRYLRVPFHGDADDILVAVREETHRRPRGSWIIGRGFNRGGFRREPRMSALEGAAQGHPVLLLSWDHHTAWVNRTALVRLGLPTSEAGRTGILRESRAFWAYERALEEDGQAIDLADDVRVAVRRLAKQGLVGVTAIEGEAGLEAIQRVVSEERRLRVQVFLRADAAPKYWLEGHVLPSDAWWFTVLGIKLFMDGALGSRTAWMKQPYQDSTHVGLPQLDPATLRRWLAEAWQHQQVVAIHAIGDQALHQTIQVLEEMNVGLSPRGRYTRIEHAQLIDDEDLARLERLPVALSMQPVHLFHDRHLADRYWGSRARHAFRARDAVARGLRVVFGSDAPVASADITAGLWAAVHRADDGESAWYPQQRLGPGDAIDAYTRVPAQVDARPSGILEPGHWADLTLWSDDPYEALERKARDRLMVVGTIVGGRRVD
ncbi:MAG: amidohydrolase family protein [Firmicutes bacterium]|nr:amidohydrolase family protein [Bacillota bacterium]